MLKIEAGRVLCPTEDTVLLTPSDIPSVGGIKANPIEIFYSNFYRFWHPDDSVSGPTPASPKAPPPEYYGRASIKIFPFSSIVLLTYLDLVPHAFDSESVFGGSADCTFSNPNLYITEQDFGTEYDNMKEAHLLLHYADRSFGYNYRNEPIPVDVNVKLNIIKLDEDNRRRVQLLFYKQILSIWPPSPNFVIGANNINRILLLRDCSQDRYL